MCFLKNKNDVDIVKWIFVFYFYKTHFICVVISFLDHKEILNMIHKESLICKNNIDKGSIVTIPSTIF